jgi:hypothetical protein
VLAQCTAGDLWVVLLTLTRAEAGTLPGAMPPIEPLDPLEQRPVPSVLPPGLVVRRLGEGFCAVDDAGALVLNWIALGLQHNEALPLGWPLHEGPPPVLQVFERRGRTAIGLSTSWSVASAERLPLVIVRADREHCWLVSGRLALEELVEIAVSLP